MANDQDPIGFEWPIGLTLRDLYRIIWGRWHARMPEVIGELAQKGKKLLLEDAYAFAEDIQRVSDATGAFILDPAEKPERFNPPDLPTCVLIAQGGEFISPVRMQEIVDLYHGYNLPDDLPSNERSLRIHQQRGRLVLTRGCRHDGCTEIVVVTVELAGRAIIGHRLIEIGAPYEPPSLCKRHRTERDNSMKQKRSRKHSNHKKKGKGKALGTIGDVAPPLNTAVLAKAQEAPEETPQEIELTTPDPTEEETNVDCPVPATAAVEEPAEEQAEV